MKLACMQVPALSSDVMGNLERLEKFAITAKAAGCDLLVTPEMYVTGYNIGAGEVRRLAEPRTGFYFEQVAKIARLAGLAILFGYPERDSASNVVFNSVQLIDQTGQCIADYRKTHLFGQVDRQQFQAGEARSKLVTLNGWKVALAICYDIEFPELARAYTLDGADMILTPTANMVPFDSVAKRLVPARAEENGVFIVYANYCGFEGAFDYCGSSCICGPDGNDLARAGDDETLIMAELDRSKIPDVRQGAQYLNDLRPDIYRR